MMIDYTGQQVGNYRMVRRLGVGGFASVYLGQHIRIATQQAAIKILHIVDVDMEAFQREAETMATLQHPNIVRLFDFDLHNEMPFLVMDFASGGSLHARHKKGEQVPLATVVQYIKEIAGALQYAHDKNIIHRDIKPENILIGSFDELRLSDFGISVLSKTGRGSLYTPFGMGGTPHYMAPEMFQNKPEKASDQYSLGIMAYELLSATRPFEGDALQIYIQHATQPVPPLRDILPTLPPHVEAVILKALEKDTKNRFPFVRAFAEALEAASQTLPTSTAPTIGAHLFTCAGHTDSVYDVKWSPDGSQLASASNDGTARVWKASSGRSLFTFTGHTHRVNAVSWSPDGLRLASASDDKTARIWGTSSDGPVFTCAGHTEWVNAVSWSPNGARLASASSDTTARVWDANSGRLLSIYTDHTAPLLTVSWSPDSSRLASASNDKSVQVWDATNSRSLFTCIGHTDSVRAVCWSPNGARLASASSDKTVQVWDAGSGRPLFTCTGHAASVRTVSWSPDGSRLASASWDKTVRIWDASNGQLLFTYTDHTAYVYAASWSPDGTRLASASADGTVQVWQAV